MPRFEYPPAGPVTITKPDGTTVIRRARSPRPPARKAHRTKQQAWAETRRLHLLTYPECRVCERTDRPNVHHIRYRGPKGISERPGDLVTLCETHHHEFHRRYPKGSLVKNTLAFIKEKRALALDVVVTHELPPP